jgi:4a-hydroxytetrahydrobiopterin dehydratase
LSPAGRWNVKPRDSAVEKPVANPVHRAIPPHHITPAMSQILDSKQIKAALKDLPEWDLEKNAIERTFEFDDFAGAIDFVNGVAELAEEMEHHPDMDIRYSKVRVILSTHSKGGLTEMDFELAERIGNLVDA